MRDADRWGGLQVRQLRALTAVVDEGSVAAAARALGYTQSGVSQQILALERIVGARLLVRQPGGRRPLELTEPGQIVLAHARSLLRRVRATQADLEALVAGAAGELTVATIQSVGARILPSVLARFRESHDGVQVRIQEATAVDALLAAVESGEADIGFTALPVAEELFDLHPLLADPYVLVTSADAPERTLADLDRKRLLGIRGCLHDRLVEQASLPLAYDGTRRVSPSQAKDAREDPVEQLPPPAARIITPISSTRGSRGDREVARLPRASPPDCAPSVLALKAAVQRRGLLELRRDPWPARISPRSRRWSVRALA